MPSTKPLASLDPRLDALFSPRSIAIVGASGNPASLLARPLRHLLDHGFDGPIYPVNPRYEEVGGLRCYPTLTSIEAPVDLVLVGVAAPHVVESIDQCAAIGASVAVILSSGFAETGAEGRAEQERVISAARAGGVRVIGPNCQGVMYTPEAVFATFTPAAAGAVPDTGFAFVGQSGALGGSLLGMARDSGLGMTAWVSVGNQADCTVTEVARALLERDAVRVLALYLESVDDPGGLVDMMRRAAALEKQIVFLAAGQTAAGWRAAVSHTGALVQPGAALTAVARRLGATAVHDIDELHDASHTLLAHHRGAGRRVAAVTTSGGAGSLLADHLDRAGLVVANVPAPLKERLARYVPDFGSLENPVDVTAQLFNGEGQDFGTVCELIASDPAFDQMIVIVTQLADEMGARFARHFVELARRTRIPIHVCWLSGRSYTQMGREILRAAGIPIHGSIRSAVGAAARIAAASPGPLPVWPEDGDARFAGLPGTLTEHSAAALMDVAGAPRPRSVLVTDPAHAAEAVRSVGGHAVAKVQSTAALHKTELGLVQIGVTESDAAELVAELLAAAGEISEGVLVQEQLPAGIELLVSVTRVPPGFPPLLTVGAGGIATEVMRDVASTLLPASAAEVRELLLSLRVGTVLQGHRGHPGYDVEAATEAVLAVARAAELVGGRLRELEVNPLIVQPSGGGAHVADVLTRLAPMEGT